MVRHIMVQYQHTDARPILKKGKECSNGLQTDRKFQLHCQFSPKQIAAGMEIIPKNPKPASHSSHLYHLNLADHNAGASQASLLNFIKAACLNGNAISLSL